jgi:hypothetical protein
MMYEAQWTNTEHNAVYMGFNGTWHADEFAEAEQALHAMLSEVGHRVSVLVHLAQPQPISMQMIPQIRKLIDLAHPNRDQVVIVAAEDYGRALSEIVRRAFGGKQPDHLHFARSMEEAEGLIA